jgi:hypothetical protein
MKQPVVHSGSIRDTMAIVLSPLLGELLPANRPGGADRLIYVSDEVSMPWLYSPMFARPTVDRRLSA